MILREGDRKGTKEGEVLLDGEGKTLENVGREDAICVRLASIIEVVVCVCKREADRQIIKGNICVPIYLRMCHLRILNVRFETLGRSR